MPRRILAVLAALFTWIVVASIADRILRLSWQGYADVEVAMLFTLPMLLLRLLIGALASVCAGLSTAFFRRSDPLPASIVAGILFVFFVPVHHSLWERFPVWTHAVFLASLIVLPPLGFATRRRAGTGP